MNTTLIYSPNFNKKKRKSKDIKFIIFHYTGMKRENDAIKRLTSFNSKVSSHYFIKKNGEILTLVPDLYVAWHAGISSWKKYKFLNKNSIGIEISNPGYENNYRHFNERQIRSVLRLSRFLINKYKIKSKFILGHSDISPDRKKDPGEKFPWKDLFKKRIGMWHDLNKKILIKNRNQAISLIEKNTFYKNLYKIGYSENPNKKNINYLKKLTTVFQMRFRQELINSIVDKECLIITKNLTKKFL